MQTENTRLFMRHYILIILFLVLGVKMTHAQDEQEADKVHVDEIKLSFLQKRAQAKRKAIEEGKWWISPFFGPAYTPDFGAMLAGGALLTFKTNKNDSLIQRSSIPITFVASTEGNTSFVSQFSTFWSKDKYRFNGTLLYAKVIDQYYGVGYENNSTIPKGKETTEFTRFTTIINPIFLIRTWNDFYFGAAVDLNWNKARDVNPTMLQDEYYLEYRDQYFNAGLGISGQYDSRDIAVNAYKGWYIQYSLYFYGGYIGGDYSYQIGQLDVRKYWRIKRDGRTVAARLGSRVGFGDVPYTELSRVGGSEELRGYLKNQYRDKKAVTLVGEYRHMFLKRDGSLSKHGAVAFTGLGFLEGEDSSPLLYTLGAGYRLEVQPRMNIRVDFGLGKDTSGFYFSINEAF